MKYRGPGQATPPGQRLAPPPRALRPGAYVGNARGRATCPAWPKIDFDGGTVSALRTLKAQKGGVFTLESPKSSRSRRAVDHPRLTLDALKAHREKMRGEDHDVKTGAVFVTSNGTFIGKSNLIHQVHRPLLERAGLPVYKFHALRHTHASKLLARGRNLREVSERLGHSSPALTLKVYAHLLPGAGKEPAKVLDQMFGSGLSYSLATFGPFRPPSARKRKRHKVLPLWRLCLEPPDRVELSTPALRKRCSAD